MYNSKGTEIRCLLSYLGFGYFPNGYHAPAAEIVISLHTSKVCAGRLIEGNLSAGLIGYTINHLVCFHQMSHFLATDNCNRASTGTELLSCLHESICSCRRCAVRSNEKNNLLSGVAAVGDTFISFHIIPPVLSPVDYYFVFINVGQ